MAQEDPQLITYIREQHLRHPPSENHKVQTNLDVEAIPELGELFNWKVNFSSNMVISLQNL